MKRIAIFSYDLTVGGIQKSLLNLVNNIDYGTYDVDLFLFAKEEFWNVDFPEQLNVRYLEPLSPFYTFAPFEMAMKKPRFDFSAYGEYDLAIDFNSYQVSCAVAALQAPARYRVSWIHNDVEIKLENEWKYRVLWNAFKGKFVYFDEFVGVSEALIEPFKKCSGVTDKKYCVIPNLIDVNEIRAKIADSDETPDLDKNCMNFVALGHLNHQKAYDIMIDAFAKAYKARPELRLYIMGDGPERENLERQINLLSMQGIVNLLGYRKNPYSVMNEMDAFISTSRYEGQGMNILEAMAVGLPVYCTKNLERYINGLKGYEDIASAIIGAEKEQKHPDDLLEYNKAIKNAISDLIERAAAAE